MKAHLLSFGYDRLKQTGDKGSRKRTNNKWFETQDSIGYWEDFSKQKIIFQEMVQEPSFFLDLEGKFMCLDTARIIVGENLDVLLAVMNSKLFFYSIKTFYGGGGLGETGVRMKHTFFENFPMPKLSIHDKKEILIHVKNITETSLKRINKILYSSYLLNEKEIEFIELQ